MIISHGQVKVMHAAFVAEAARRIGRFLDEHCDLSRPYDGSKPPKPGTERDKVILDLVSRARRDFELHSERGMTQFVILGLGYSRTFYEIPGVKALLTQASVPPEQCMQAVLDKVVLAEARAR